jgi:autotransporter translocation and assembly factor TamB
MRRWLRRLGYVLGGTLALVLVLIALVVVALRTDGGRELIRQQAEKFLAKTLNGEVTIGRLDGALPGEVVLVDVVVKDRTGRTLATFPRLEATLELEDLLVKTIHLRRVVMTAPTIAVTQRPDGLWDVMDLLPPSDPNAEPFSWRIEVDKARLDGGVIRVTPLGKLPIDVAGLEVSLGMEMEGEELEVELRRVAALWLGRALPVDLAGKLRKRGDKLTADGVRLAVGGSRVVVQRLDLDGAVLDARAVLDLRAADLIRIAPGNPWKGDLLASATVTRAGAPAPYVASVSGTLGGARLALDGHYDPGFAAGEARVRLSEIHPASLVRGADPRARIDEVALAATLVGDEVVASLDGRAPGASLAVDAVVSLAEPRLRFVRAVGDVPAVERFAGELAPVRGALTLDVTGHGTLDDLAVAGQVGATGVGYADVRATQLSAVFDLQGLPSRAAGTARVRADGVAKGKLPIGFVQGDVTMRDQARHLEVSIDTGGKRVPYAVTARATVDREPDGTTRVNVAAVQIRTRQLLWNGGPAGVTLRPDGQITLDNVELASKAGAVTASGSLGATGDRLQVTMRRLSIAELSRAFVPGDPKVSGQIDGKVLVVRRQRRLSELRADVHTSRLSWKNGADPIQVDLALKLLGRDLTGGIQVDGGRTGTIALDLESRTPVDPLDPKAWADLDEKDVKKIGLKLGKLDLERVGELAGLRMRIDGLVDADLAVSDGFRKLDGTVTAKRVLVPSLDPRVDADVKVTLANGKLDLGANAAIDKGGTVQLVARLSAPRKLTQTAAWGELDEDDVERASLTFQGVDLAKVTPIREQLPDLRGTLLGTLTMKAKGTDVVTADIHVDGLRHQKIEGTFSGQLETSLYRDRLVARVTSSFGQQQLVTGDLTTAAGLDLLLAGDTERLRQASAKGKLSAQKIPLEQITKTFRLPVDMRGSLDANAVLSGSLAAPELDARLALAPGGRLQGVVFDKLETTAKLDRAKLVAHMSAAQQGGGTLEGDANVDTANPRIGKARLQAKRFDLRFLSLMEAATGFGVRKGMLEADVNLEGTATGRAASGRLAIRDGEVRVSELVSVLRDLSLDVTVDGKGAITAKLDSKTAKSGSLTIDATGSIAGLALGGSKGTFRSRDLTVSTGRTKIEADVDGTFTGKPQEDAYHLYLTTKSGEVRIPQRLGADKLHDTGELEDVVYVDAEGLDSYEPRGAGGPIVVVHVDTSRPLLVTSKEVRADVSVARLSVAVGADLVIRGRIQVESGYLELFSRRWQFQQSRVQFAGEVPMNPKLDIRLQHEFRTTTVNIALGGTLEMPDLKLSSSDGAYDQAQLIGFVLGGSPDDQGGPAGDADVSQQAIDAASGLLFGQVQPLLKKVVPVDVISLKRKTGATEETLLTVGKWLSSKLFISYRHRFSERTATDNANEGTLEWYFLRKWRLELVFGDRGEGSADVLWLNRW